MAMLGVIVHIRHSNSSDNNWWSAHLMLASITLRWDLSVVLLCHWPFSPGAEQLWMEMGRVGIWKLIKQSLYSLPFPQFPQQFSWRFNFCNCAHWLLWLLLTHARCHLRLLIQLSIYIRTSHETSVVSLLAWGFERAVLPAFHWHGPFSENIVKLVFSQRLLLTSISVPSLGFMGLQAMHYTSPSWSQNERVFVGQRQHAAYNI